MFLCFVSQLTNWTIAICRRPRHRIVGWDHQRVGEDCLLEFGPAIACMNVWDDTSSICQAVAVDRVDKSMWQHIAWWTGLVLGILAMWPKMELWHLTIWSITSQDCDFNIPDVVLPSDAEYLTLTLHFKLSRILASSARTVHISAAYRSIERTSALYARNLVGRDNHLSHHIFFNDAITEHARAIREYGCLILNRTVSFEQHKLVNMLFIYRKVSGQSWKQLMLKRMMPELFKICIAFTMLCLCQCDVHTDDVVSLFFIYYWIIWC